MTRTFLLLSLLLLLAACRRAPLPPPTLAPTAVTLPLPSPLPQGEGTATAPTTPPAAGATATTATVTTAPPPAGATSSPAANTCQVTPAGCDLFAAGLVDPAADVVPGAPIYTLDVAIADNLRTVTGWQSVFYTNQEDTPLSEIVFHLHPNLLDSAITVSDVTVDSVAATPGLSGAGRSIMTVPLPAPLPPGGTITLALSFRTDVATEIGRNYGVLAYTDGILALAHFYPMLSVYDAGGWNTDEAVIQGDLTHSDAGYYLVRVSAPEGVTLVASGVEVADPLPNPPPEGEGARTVVYAVGPARDFYLAAGEFAVVSQTVGATTINSYAPAELADGAALALEVAAEALTINEKRLSPYPYTELDIVTTPTAALGIEYPGLIVGTLRMYDVAASTQAGVPYSAILESTTAHEVIHQWFYNLVGNDQLDEPWLDESMTGYQTYRYYVDRYGQATGDGYFENFDGRWASVDHEPIPIGRPVRAYEGPEYGAIVYGRGPFFLRALEEMMGRAAFDAFLADYAAQYRWRHATTAGFRALAESHCGCDLGPLFAEWVYE